MPELLDHDTYVRLCRSRDFLAGAFRERLTLEMAARSAHLSPWHFHRLFRRAFGETPHEFVTGLRLKEAQRLLAGGQASVTEICLEVGYGSLGSFSLWFHSLAGCSPSQYRRAARRVFPGWTPPWPAIPTCLLEFFGGGITQDSRSVAVRPRLF